MNRTQRKLFLGFATHTGVKLTAITAVLSYAAYQDQLARFGDIFDHVVSQQTQTWVFPSLVVVVGLTLVGFIIFIGLWKFYQTDSKDD
jgi:hypothetical protein